MRRAIITTAALVASALLVAGCTSSGGGHGSTAAPGGSGSSKGTGAAPVTAATTSLPSTSTSRGTSSGSRSAGVSAPALHDFQIADVTWVGTEGWALGEADCLSGSGRCDAIEHTTDGRTWSSMPAPRAQAFVYGTDPTQCSAPCVSGIRFATSKIGYAYGSATVGSQRSGAFFLTTDGGRSWRSESGGAYDLETLDGTVIRVDYRQGIPGPMTVQVAPIGSTSWQTVDTPGFDVSFGSVLGRAAGTSYLLDLGHPAGGGNDARSTLFVSTDGGHHWANRGEPCPQSGGKEVDSTRLSVAPDGSASVVCQVRIGPTRPFTATTTDRGASFHAGSRTALGNVGYTGFGAASSTTLLICVADTFRSTDDGHSFTRLGANGGSSPGVPDYIAFSTPSVGHAISEDRHTLFTTTDGGATWSGHRFS